MRRIVVLSFLGTRKCALNAMRRPAAREEGRAAPSVRRAVAPPLAEPRHAIATSGWRRLRAGEGRGGGPDAPLRGRSGVLDAVRRVEGPRRG